MSVKPISVSNYACSVNKGSVAFGEDKNKVERTSAQVDTSLNDIKSAKMYAAFAGIGSLGSLIISGLMLRKAGNIEKATKPLVSRFGNFDKIIDTLNKLSKDTGLNNAIDFAGNILHSALEQGRDSFKKVSVILGKINKEEDPEVLENLNGQLSEELGNTILKFVEDVDKNHSKNIDSLLDSPILNVIKSINNGKVELSKEVPQGIAKAREIVAKNPSLSKVVELLDELSAGSEEATKIV